VSLRTDPDEDVRRALLLASITDIQGSIKANDAKTSAALVVHGLLFTGVLTVAKEVGPVYEAASRGARSLVIAFVALALTMFLVSVFSLMLAAVPYRPKRVAHDISHEYLGVFFPQQDALRKRGSGESDGVRQLRGMDALVAELDRRNAIRELSAEVVKLADVLAYEGRWTKRGYRALSIEVVCVASFLSVVGLVAVT
jgi:hypothetical protein